MIKRSQSKGLLSIATLCWFSWSLQVNLSSSFLLRRNTRAHTSLHVQRNPLEKLHHYFTSDLMKDEITSNKSQYTIPYTVPLSLSNSHETKAIKLNQEGFMPVESIQDQSFSSSPSMSCIPLEDQIKAIAASTAAMTVASIHAQYQQQQQQQQQQYGYIQRHNPHDLNRMEALETRIDRLEEAVGRSKSSSLPHYIDQNELFRQEIETKVERLKTELEEVRDYYESVTVKWCVDDFLSKIRATGFTRITSEKFWVAGRPMKLELHVQDLQEEEQVDDQKDYWWVPSERGMVRQSHDRMVGFFVASCESLPTNSKSISPINLGGTKIILSKDQYKEERTFGPNASIKHQPESTGWGWDSFLTLQELCGKYVTKTGRLQMTFQVRVKRVPSSFDVNVAMISD